MNKIEEKLRNSPINYFSDLFIAAMVTAWMVIIVLMAVFAIYATVVIGDTAIWSELGTLVAVPLSCGGAIWMVKNSVQHAIANNKGQSAHMDFPKVNADGEDEGKETADGEDEEKEVAEESSDAEG